MVILNYWLANHLQHVYTWNKAVLLWNSNLSEALKNSRGYEILTTRSRIIDLLTCQKWLKNSKIYREKYVKFYKFVPQEFHLNPFKD